MNRVAPILAVLIGAACVRAGFSPPVASAPVPDVVQMSMEGGISQSGPSPAPSRGEAPAAEIALGEDSPIENPAALFSFFSALAALEGGWARDDVRIVQFGDSHTAADIETAALRHRLQERFGDGGRGFVALGRPWKTYIQEGVRGGMSVDWSPERGKFAQGTFLGDGCYGLNGVSLLGSKRGASAWARITSPASFIELSYLEQPGGGTFDVIVDGVQMAQVVSSAVTQASAFHVLDVREGPHDIEIRPLGDGPVRFFGVILDRDALGVTVDALGINGARATTVLQWSEQHLSEQLRHRSPQLIVIAYGTNDAGDETPADVYERRLTELLARMMRGAPSASCLMLGPPDRAMKTGQGDWITTPKLIEVIGSQRRVARASGCAFFSQFSVMGGLGSVANWALETPPRAQKDRVHLAREGYVLLGNTFATSLLRAYDVWLGGATQHVVVGGVPQRG